MSSANRFMGRRLLFSVIIGGVLIGFLWLNQKRRHGAESIRPQESVRLGLGLQPSSALAIIACEQGFFREEGLEITCKDYASGKRALAALFEGQVDAATATQVPVVLGAFQRQDFRTIATIAYVTNVQRVVARRDRGINRPTDLRGKRVATQRASAVHFSLHMFLVKNGLSEKDIQLSFLEPEELPNALVSGQIDAFSMREPYVSQALRLLGDNAVVFSEPGIDFQPEHLVIAAETLRSKPEVASKMLRALIKAEQLAENNRDRALDIVADRLKGSRNALASSWGDLDLTVTLDQSLLNSMEDVARWAMGDGLVKNRQIPNFLRVIDTRGLDDANPEAVTIIH